MTFLRALKFLIGIFGKPLYRASIFLHFFIVGKEYGYPACCAAHFAWNQADPKFRRARPRRGPAQLRGTIYINEDKIYVPCGIHKRRHPEWRPFGYADRKQLRLFIMENNL